MSARLVILVSGTGSNMAALLDACKDPSYGATVVAVGADREGTAALAIAEAQGVPTFICKVSDFAARADWDVALCAEIAAHEPDLVISAGFMKILGEKTLSSFPDRIINTHPSLLPAFVGATAVRDALDYGVKLTGATVHLVDAVLDGGPILGQVSVEVMQNDDESSLHARIKDAERELLVDVVGRMGRGYQLVGRKVVL